MEQGRMTVIDRIECMINDITLMSPAGHQSSGVTLRSYQEWGGRRHELNMKWQG